MLTHRLIAGAVVVFAASLAMGTPDAFAVDATLVTVSTSPTAPVWGEPVALAVTVTDTTVPTAIPTGSVRFSVDDVPIGSAVTLVTGAAGLPIGLPDIGPHTIAAAYTPDDAAYDVDSGTATMTIAKAETATTLGAVPNPAVAGQNATFTATVTVTPPGAGTPIGTVRFAEGTDFLDQPLDLGHSSFVGYAFAGLYTVHATYSGDRHFTSSTGSVDTQVNRAATTTALTISPNPATPGAAIAFRAIVSIQPPGDVAPGGSLQFTIDGAPVGAAIGLGSGVIGYEGNLNAPPGNRTYLVAVGYSGDEDTEPSSAAVAVTVSAPALPSTAASTPTVAVSHLSAMASTLTTALRLRGFAALTTTIETIAAGPGLLDQKVYSPAAPNAGRAAATKRVDDRLRTPPLHGRRHGHAAAQAHQLRAVELCVTPSR